MEYVVKGKLGIKYTTEVESFLASNKSIRKLNLSKGGELRIAPIGKLDRISFEIWFDNDKLTTKTYQEVIKLMNEHKIEGWVSWHRCLHDEATEVPCSYEAVYHYPEDGGAK